MTAIGTARARPLWAQSSRSLRSASITALRDRTDTHNQLDNWTSPSISIAKPNGRSDTPMADRAWRPTFAPKTSMMRSLKPFTTRCCSVYPGLDATIPNTRVQPAIRDSSPISAFIFAKTDSAILRASAWASSVVKSTPTTPNGPAILPSLALFGLPENSNLSPRTLTKEKGRLTPIGGFAGAGRLNPSASILSSGVAMFGLRTSFLLG